MTALLLASLTLAAPEPVWKAGDRIEAQVEIRMANKAEELDLVEIESWTLEIDRVETDAVQARLTRSLLETRLNGSYAGAPPGEGRVEPWTFRPDGGLAFRPPVQTALEGRLYRVIAALLPFNGGDPAGRTTVESPDEPRQGLPPAVLARELRKREGGLRAVDVTYREGGLRLSGRASIDEQNGWPLFWTLRISGLRLEGGEIPVETTVTMIASKAKIRGQNVGLPEKKDEPKTKKPG